jgi:hypothetical protein
MSITKIVGLEIFEKQYSFKCFITESINQNVAIAFQKLYLIDCDYKEVYKLIQTDFKVHKNGTERSKCLFKYKSYYLYCEVFKDSGELTFIFYI